MCSSHKPNSFMQLLVQTYNMHKEKYVKNIDKSKKTEINLQDKPKQKTKQKRNLKKKQQNKIIQVIKQSDQDQADTHNKDKRQYISNIELKKHALKHQKREKIQQSNNFNKVSQVVIQEITQDPAYQSHFLSQDSEIKQINADDIQSQQLIEVDKKTFEQSQRNQYQILQIEQISIDEWIPSKKQSTLLNIQKIIDEFFMSKFDNRRNEPVLISKLIAYMRDSKGICFNFSILLCILKLNPQLYQLENKAQSKYISCVKLNSQLIERRQIKTQQFMKKKK